ncbi:hypothetical protein B0T36_22915 [Nocardia donostiensis]|uniref:hypothetical protein n=1 Tax=Nocardia donostiensis TaxID=1538463 RepID=UPI0009DB0EAB|nr:hypothetical protein [Nocardia donostiensis]OQS12817.1 hypothetical protein B0T36_22915 [Nocardia donostiensis]
MNYDAVVYFGPISLDAFQQDPTFQDYRVTGPTTIADRAAVEFGDRLDPERKERCYFGVELSEGIALIWSRLPVGPGGGAPQGDSGDRTVG